MPTTTTGLATSFINFSRPSASGGGATVTLSNGKIGWAGHNLLTNSESFDAAAWSGVGVAIAANDAVAPNGTTTADRMTASSTSTFRETGQFYTLLANVKYTISFFVKAGNTNWCYVMASDRSANADGFYFNASGSGAVGSTTVKAGTTVTASNPRVTAVANSFVLCSIDVISTTDKSYAIDIGVVDADASGSVTSGKYIHLWGAHLYRSDLGGMQGNPAMPAGMGSYYPTTPRNLLGYTEDFSNAAWIKTQIAAFGSGSISNAIIAPNGLQTADKIVASAAAGYHAIRQSATVTTAPYVFSFYAKAAEYSLCYVTDIQGAQFRVAFNLTTGAVVAGTTGGAGYVSSAITSVGDGWYRCSISLSGMASNPTFALIGYPSSGATLDAYGLQYTGDGVSGVYLWGAQLSDSASLDTYVPVYGAAVSSAAYYAPRLDFDPVTLAARGLLVEEQRVNLLTYSQNLSTGWVAAKGGTGVLPTITNNYAVSPDGTQTAGRIEMSLGGGTTTSDTSVIYHDPLTIVNATAYTYSVWLKSNDTNTYTILLRDDAGSSAASTLLTVTPTWQRFTFTATSSTTTSVGIKLWLRGNQGTSSTADILFYGAQMEAGSFATSYIPTGSAAATRTADVASVSTQAFPYSASEGTIVVNAAIGPLSDNKTLVNMSLDTDAAGSLERGQIRINSSSGTAQMIVANGGSATGSATTTNGASANSTLKAGYALATNDLAVVLNAGTVATDPTVTIPNCNQLRIGRLGSIEYLNGHIRQITYIPRRISNAELQSRTA